MSEYIYPVTILSRDITVPFKELKNKDYKNFVKVVSYDDPVTFERFTNNLIEELCADDIDISKLTNVDKFYILICIRANCVSTELTLVTSAEEDDEESVDEAEVGEKKKDIEYKIPIQLNDILHKLGEYDIDHVYSIKDDTITINGTLPKKFFYDNIYDVAADTISEILFDDKHIKVDGLSIDEKQNILSKLPSFALPKILNFIEAQQNILENDPLVKFNTEKKLPVGDRFDLHVFNGVIPQLIKIMFNSQLKDFYSTEYALMRRFKFSYDAICNSTPAELSLYYNIIHADVERERREMESEQSKQKAMGGNIGSQS